MALYTLQTNWWEIKEVVLEWSGDNSIEGENRERKECQAGEEGFLLICSFLLDIYACIYASLCGMRRGQALRRVREDETERLS
ncbi:hypothetical protein DL95DRAFT_391170 [Leptodontidium sp. 2 PMI_412]|nr:hypothetical protein DL95DRAFT_391170 [Leptodontidium sp. 2 PMI_412]